MRALRGFRACVVQETPEDWAIYVQADPSLIADLVAAVGLARCHAVGESELAAAGITHP